MELLGASARIYREHVLFSNQETGLALPPAPEFGPDGSWPPAATDWVPLRWDLFDVACQIDRRAAVAHALSWRFGRDEHCDRPLCTENALNEDFLYRSTFAGLGEVTMFEHRGKLSLVLDYGKAARDRTKDFDDRYAELRRLVHAVRWRRADPVTQLPPGAAHELTYAITTGLSMESSLRLASSLGLSIAGDAPGLQTTLSSQIQEEFVLKLDVSAQEQRSSKLTLSNQSTKRSRIFALWHVDHQITVDALRVGDGDMEKRQFGTFDDLHTFWEPREKIEWVAHSDPHITYAEVSRG